MGISLVPVGLVLVLVLVLVLIIKKLLLTDQNSTIPLAPLKSKVPIVGYVIDLLTLAPSPWEVIASWIKTKGNVLRFHFFRTNFVVVAEPELIKHIFQTKFQVYQKDIAISYSSFMPLLGKGLVTSHGEHWMYQRKLLGAVFKIEILEDTARVALHAVNSLSAKLNDMIEKNNGSIEIEISEEFRRLTLQVIGEAVLSMTPEESDKVFPSLYLPIVDHANENVWYPWKAYLPSPATIQAHKALRDLNNFFSDTIKKRIENFNPDDTTKKNKDILDKILSGMHGGSSLTEPWVIPQIRDEIKTFILAGHETSSMMLTWALYELFRHPHCMQKVLDEANKVFPPSLNGELPPYEKLQELQYTQNVLKEALRKYYIVPVVTRVAVEDDHLGEHFIPKGTRIVIPILSVNHRADLWDAPSEFRPERFEQTDMHPFQFLGFIAGARRCLGQHFALLETKIVLALLVQRFAFGGHPSGKTHPYKVPVCPNEGMNMEISKREK